MFGLVFLLIAATPSSALATAATGAELAIEPFVIGSPKSTSAVLDAAHRCGFSFIRAKMIGPNLSEMYIGASDHVAMDCTFAWIRQHRNRLHLAKAPDATNAVR
jgi:hypothetical protein